MAISFSDSVDFFFNTQDKVLDVYLPVLPKYKELMQELMDLEIPKRETYLAGTLVAIEWSFTGRKVNKVLSNKKWQELLK